MKNSNIKCIQKQLNDGYQTIISFGKRIQKPLSKNRIKLLTKQLEISRLLQPKQLWTSNVLETIVHPTTGLVIGYKTIKVQGTYEFAIHGELNKD